MMPQGTAVNATLTLFWGVVLGSWGFVLPTLLSAVAEEILVLVEAGRFLGVRGYCRVGLWGGPSV